MAYFVKFFLRAAPWAIALGLLWLFVEQKQQRDALQETVAQQENPLTVLKEIERIGKLELVKFKFKDVLRFKKSSGYLLVPDQEVLMVVSGEAVGCIDLMKLDSADIGQYGDTLICTLPPPELCYAKLDLDSTKVYDLSFSKVFDKTDLVQEAYRQAEAKVEQLAMNSGILEQTRQNAVLVLQPMLQNFSGDRKVIVRFAPASVPIELQR